MLTLILVEVFAAAGIILRSLTRGLESALPFATFMIVLAPTDAFLPLGFFGLTTQRLVVILLTILFFLTGSGKGRSANRYGTPLAVLMVISVFWFLVSTVDSIVPTASIKQMLSVVFDYYMLYLIYLNTVTKVETIHKILMGMVLGIMTASVFGFIEAYWQWSVMSLFPEVQHLFGMGDGSRLLMGGERGLRVHATYPHAILFGMGVVTAILLTIYLLSVTSKRKQQYLLWGGLLLMFLNLYKTMSRGPWFGAILGCVLLFFLAREGMRKRILLIGALSVATLIIRPGVWQVLKNVYASTFDPTTITGGSFEYRFALQDVAIQRLMEDPQRAVLGFGLGSFYYVGLVGDLSGNEQTFLSGDNGWVVLMVHTGFVGLFIMFLLLGKPAWIAWKQFLRYPKPERYLSLVLFVNLIVFYVEMWGVAVYGWGQNGYMLWTMIALIFAYPRCRETEALQKHGEENPLLAMDADSDLEPAWPVEDRPRSNA